mgnify:CR=1 FL=1
MIVGIGTDLCDIRRIEQVRSRFPLNFDKKILTYREREELSARSQKNAYVAKRFAAKEALYKAFHFSDQNSLGWQQAEILNQGKKRGSCCSSVRKLSKQIQPAVGSRANRCYSSFFNRRISVCYGLCDIGKNIKNLNSV